MSHWNFMFLWHAIWYQLFPSTYGFSLMSERVRCGGIAPFYCQLKRHQPFSGRSIWGQNSSVGTAFERSGSRARRRAASSVAPLSAASPTSSSAASVSASVIDFYANLEDLYDRSSAIKCPFFRRRAADLIDDVAEVARFLLIRHKSLPGVSDLFLDEDPSTTMTAASFPEDSSSSPTSSRAVVVVDQEVFSAPGCKPLGRHIRRNPDGTARKTRGLPLSDVARRIRADWTGGVAGEGKGYYITGRLDSTIYRDDCLFTGPDPDMPVRGLRKYLSAAAHLFDPRESDAVLLSLEVREEGGERGFGALEVRWRLGGVIQLPWHPTVEPWTGMTVYHLDEDGLIYLHEERWDISVWRAFICTLFPEAKTWRIWDTEKMIVHL